MTETIAEIISMHRARRRTPEETVAQSFARIRAFFVDPAWARRGVGRQLLEACETAARAAGFTRLELAATLPGVPLYEIAGYRAVEQLAVPMPEGETLPIVRMEKHLPA